MPNDTSPARVLITGASRGVGRALQALYATRGCVTFPLVRREQDAESITNDWPTGCHPIVTDLRDDQATNDIQRALDAHDGALDLLINNAGVAGQAYTFDTITPQELVDQCQVHAVGALRATLAALPAIKRAQRPVIVNITSRLGSMTRNASGEFVGKPFTIAYRMAKAAQNMLTLCLHQQLADDGVRVYALHPGRVMTDSGSFDADISATDAAQRIAHWIEQANDTQRGQCYDAQTGELIPW